MTLLLPTQNLDPFTTANKFHPTPESSYIYYEKYSRWNPELNRRETWPETVERAVNFLRELSHNKLDDAVYEELHQAILAMEVLPSMRLLAMAGDAARRTNICLYNCAYLPVDSIDAFVESLIISMCGTGVGYSVERQYVNQLPRIIAQKNYPVGTFVVPDTSEGWAQALRLGLEHWFHGFDLTFDYSAIRPSGSILRIKGGRASGPDPLQHMLDFARSTILSRQGSKLTSLDCHDIMGNIALGAVSGGHRRSAMISLYSWDDQDMRHCKDGEFWKDAPWRTTANNSAVLDGIHHSDDDVREHFRSMVQGGNGEPGIFSRNAARKMRPERRKDDVHFGTNPCAEITLKRWEFCNLSEVICKPEDTYVDLLRKTRLAAIIGTIQSSATHFPGLRPQWQKNCEDERLLGVGFTGQMDCPTIQEARTMVHMKEWVVRINAHYATKLGINTAASTTCVKPSGSTAILTNTSSGLHTRWAPYYIRRFRTLSNSPVAKVLRQSGVPLTPENGDDPISPVMVVSHFPVKAPDGAKTRHDMTAIEQCEYWKKVKLNLTEHNPSVTITYKPEEVQDVEDWLIENLDIVGGMAFLPYFDEHVGLEQMPYETIDESTFSILAREFPSIDYSLLSLIEREDHTTASQELSCSAGFCDII